jgi:hypothetical protein
MPAGACFAGKPVTAGRAREIGLALPVSYPLSVLIKEDIHNPSENRRLLRFLVSTERLTRQSLAMTGLLLWLHALFTTKTGHAGPVLPVAPQRRLSL